MSNQFVRCYRGSTELQVPIARIASIEPGNDGWGTIRTGDGATFDVQMEDLHESPKSKDTGLVCLVSEDCPATLPSYLRVTQISAIRLLPKEGSADDFDVVVILVDGSSHKWGGSFDTLRACFIESGYALPC